MSQQDDDKKILLFINERNEDEPDLLVRYDEIRDYFLSSRTDPGNAGYTRRYSSTAPLYRANISDKDYSRLTGSLARLKDAKFILENEARYMITGLGIAEAERLRHPTPSTVEKSNNIATIGIIVTAISVVVAIFGLIGPLAVRYGGTGESNRPVLPSERFWVAISPGKAVSEQDEKLYHRSIGDLFSEAPINPRVDGIQYSLDSESPVIETQSRGSKNPDLIKIPIKQSNLKRLHLLMNLSYTAPQFSGQILDGIEIARLWWHFNGNEAGYIPLRVGSELRDWSAGTEGAVRATTNPAVKEVWSSTAVDSEEKAIIDHLAIDIPPGYENAMLDYVVIQDLSQYVAGSENPGLMIFGVTAERNH